MSNVIKFKKVSLKERHKGKTLCRSGFHKWQVDKESQFDSKQGLLVTRLTCKRCGTTKIESR
ncbi:MAG: hypothetical protein ACC707_05135 [Thiohalomonadales bacterium]